MLNYEFPPLGGGAANATYNILKELGKRGDVDIDLVTSSTNRYRKENFSGNINVHYLDIGKKGNVHYQKNSELLKYSWKSYWYCKKLIKSKKYDLIHAFFGIPCGYIAMKLGIPYIISLRGSDVPFYSNRYRFLDKYLFRRLSGKIWKRSSRVITNSEGLKRLAQKSFPDQKIGVIYNGVDIDMFKPAGKDNKVFTAISTSRLIERKGINYLLEAFIKLSKKYSDSKLIVVGTGDMEAEYRKKYNSVNIKFIGEVDHKKLVKYYQDSDVFVLPSLNEGMSNSLLEAMACGLAIITTNTGGTEELVSDENGVVIRKKSEEDIFKALEKLYLNRNIIDNMKARSRKNSEGMSWNNIADQYRDIYKIINNNE